MAPKVLKRPAAGVGPAAKKGKTTSAEKELKAKCDTVSAGIMLHKGVPQSALTMLCGGTPAVLTVMKEDRHPMQNQFVEMIAEVLAGVEIQFNKEIESYQEQVDGADANKATLAQEQEEAEKELEKLKAATAAAEETASTDVKLVKDAAAALADSKKAQAAGDTRIKEIEEGKAKVDSVISSVVVPGKEAALSKKVLKPLHSLGKEFKLDASMLETAEGVLNKNKVSVEEAEKELEKVSQARLRKFWQTTLATSAECAGTAENSSKAENFPHLMLTFARCVDEDTSADSESGAQASEPANACLVAVTLCREDLDVTPVLTRTSAETCDNKFLETTLDADNNLVMLDFTPSEDFAKMAMCRNLVSHVQRMFKKLDVMHPGAGPRAKVRMVVSADSQSLVETLTDMRTYVVKYLRRNFELSTDNGDSSTHAVQLVEKWGYAEGTCAARVELF